MSDHEDTREHQQKIASSIFRLNTVVEWVPRIDNRLAMLLGINTALTATALVVAPEISQWGGGTIAALAVAAVLLGVSYANVYLATFPRLKGPKDSLTYFQSISNMKFEEYFSSIGHETSPEYLHDLVEQTHRNAQIVSEKFRNLKWAFRFTLLSVIPWVAALLLLSNDS